MRPHYRLEVWQDSMELVDMVYKITRNFPNEERFGLVSQMRRASISIPSNIAEGAARKGSAEFANFLNIATGSLSELETQVLISKRQHYVDDVQEIIDLIEQVSSKLSGLYNYVIKSKE